MDATTVSMRGDGTRTTLPDEAEHTLAGRVLSYEHRALGRAVRESRARRGLSQEGLGNGADLHRNYVGAIERGEINPTFRTLTRLTSGLELPLSALVELYERHAYGKQRGASQGGQV